jgi:Zn-dependent protease
MGSDKIFDLLLLLPVFLLSISLHEFAHAWAATKLGDPTPRALGRLTVNPRAHLDPLGTIMFIAGFLFQGFLFGWAKPVPVNHFNFRHPRRDFALVALSGPGSNFMQAIGWYLLWLAFLFALPFSFFLREPISYLCELGVLINIILCCFNLIPIPPLDGSRLLAWMLPPRQAAVIDGLERYGMLILMVLILTGIFGVIYSPLFHAVISLFPGFRR